MLKQRVITAAILIPLVVLAILFTSTSTFQWILAALVALAAWEWFDVVGLNSWLEKVIAFTALAVSTTLVNVYISDEIVIYAAALLWALFTVFIIIFANRALPKCVLPLFTQPWLAGFIAIATLVVFFQSSVLLHQISDIGPLLMLFVMITVWLADTGGYFAGKRWGKHRLAVMISPNKTWQGVAGALVLVFVGALLAYLAISSSELSLIHWLVLMVLTALFSIIGDLIESVFKRAHDVKDSGNLLPGHGGILDRIDSLLAAVPVFVIGIYFIGVI